MDYEKAYKEALERARKIHDEIVNNEVIGFPGQITDIFPELRESESEDERIRKWLVDYFGSIKETVWIHRDITCEQILEWLEKQKEPHYTKRNALFDKCVENCDPEVRKEVSNKVDEMLGKEQKPAWSEEDEKIMQTMIKEGDLKPSEIAWLKSLRPSWKPSVELLEALHTAAYLHEMEFYGGLKDKLRKLDEQLRKL